VLRLAEGSFGLIEGQAIDRPETTASDRPAAVVVDDLYKRFGTVEVLKSISLRAAQGEVVSILGSSGSGKSTLLRCLNLLETPSRGSITIGGETLRFAPDRKGRIPRPDRKQVERLRRSAAMVFQSFNLWSHMTILENVIEGPIHVLKRSRRDCVAEAEALLAKVGLTERRHYYPAHLSGGQQQRAAIARALAMHPKVLPLDEPTSALDPELVSEVLRVMRALAEEGRTMLVVTREMAFARDVSSRILFLHEGRVEEEGLPTEVFANPKSERLRQFLSRALTGG
jgi:octopine/nopaline transport system ATP-binding protein